MAIYSNEEYYGINTEALEEGVIGDKLHQLKTRHDAKAAFKKLPKTPNRVPKKGEISLNFPESEIDKYGIPKERLTKEQLRRFKDLEAFNDKKNQKKLNDADAKAAALETKERLLKKGYDTSKAHPYSTANKTKERLKAKYDIPTHSHTINPDKRSDEKYWDEFKAEAMKMKSHGSSFRVTLEAFENFFCEGNGKFEMSDAEYKRMRAEQDGKIASWHKYDPSYWDTVSKERTKSDKKNALAQIQGDDKGCSSKC